MLIVSPPLGRVHFVEVRSAIWQKGPDCGRCRSQSKALSRRRRSDQREMRSVGGRSSQRVGSNRDGSTCRAGAAVAHGLVCQLQVLLQWQLRPDIPCLEDAVIGAHSLFGRNLSLSDQAEHFNKGELVLGVVYLPAEERHAGP